MDLQQSISAQREVLMSIAGHVASTQGKDKNLVVSPLSIHVVLSLIAAGSGGLTRQELLWFLKSKSSDELNKLSSELVPFIFADGSPAGGPNLSFSNGLWVDQTLPLKPTFKKIVNDLYMAAANQADFLNNAIQVTSEVNSWVEDQTNGLIEELLPCGSVDHTTRLIFANALYFKGEWKEKFDTSNTKEDDFHLINGSSVKVPFMTSKKKQFIQDFEGFKVLRLPYKQGDDMRQFSMYIFLPDAKDGLPTLVEKVTSQSVFLNQHFPLKQVEVSDFRLPRFKLSFGFEASKILKGLGLQLPFSSGGFTEMVDSPVAKNLNVSSIFHKSFIEVNEQGTEAAAASAVVIAQWCSIFKKVDFVADHPFMFLIREDITGVVLFIGHVMNPLEK